MMKIGMRNIKTTLSVFVCLLVFEVINRENPIFACIAALICVQNTIVDSVKIGMIRVKGTIIGGLAAALVLFMVDTFFDANILIFIIPLGIMILIQICVTIDLKQAVVICCVVYLSISTSLHREGNYLLYTFNRVLDTSIGILIALLVNKYVKIPEIISKLIEEHTEYEEVENKKVGISEDKADNDSADNNEVDNEDNSLTLK